MLKFSVYFYLFYIYLSMYILFPFYVILMVVCTSVFEQNMTDYWSYSNKNYSEHPYDSNYSLLGWVNLENVV